MVHQLYQKSLSERLDKWQKRKARAIDPAWFEAALFLFRVNLDPLKEDLEKLYSASSRGRKHRDPVSMLRALILMSAIGQESITRFVSDLRRKPRLAIIAGFDPRDTPSVGTFYQFIDRIEDGPFQPECAHRVLPSAIRKQPVLRSLGQEKADREALRNTILAQADTITAKLKEDLLASSDRPRDFLSRLEDFLLKAAVIPSARRGLLGDPDQLIVCGDGSALVSGAGCYGKPSCECRKQGIYKCEHPRFYPDHTANWGWDSYRQVFYFGHTFYQHIVNFGGHDLPVHVDIGPASESDHTLSIKSLDRFLKASAENDLSISISAAVYDAGHDGGGNYEYLLAKQIDSVIALNPRHGSPQPSGNSQQVNPEGIPICPAGLLMRRHTTTPNHRIVFNCPVKRPTHLDGKSVWKPHVEECPQKVLCQPLTKMGPTVYIKADSDPRLYPRIARDSAKFRQLMNLRSGCERSNSVKKVTYKLDRRPCRSATHYLVRLYLISIIEHARAWVAEDRKVFGNDLCKLVDPEMIK
ncbi:MAG: transposase [Acidobacteriota bacterium]|nr:MAG: transposase [Acidobacteriota bacterium]